MAVLITGSIATDHLMSFPGRFTDSLVADKLDKVSLSFLVEELEVRRGGVAPNIACGMGCLGPRPVLVGAVGPDFAAYGSWLQRHGVDTRGVHVSDTHHTARFICTTDSEQNQIASFYPGAMSEARNIELQPVVEAVGQADVVLIGANDPGAMLRHSEECRFRGYPFAADPSQQLARREGPEITPLIEGATYLFTNEYESALIEQKTGLSAADIAAMVEIRVTTLGPDGARIERRDGERTGAPAISTLFTFRATGGIYDADTGQLVLDGEVIAMNRGGVDEDARLIWLLALIFVGLGIGGAVQLGEYLSGN